MSITTIGHHLEFENASSFVHFTNTEIHFYQNFNLNLTIENTTSYVAPDISIQ